MAGPPRVVWRGVATGRVTARLGSGTIYPLMRITMDSRRMRALSRSTAAVWAAMALAAAGAGVPVMGQQVRQDGGVAHGRRGARRRSRA